MLNMDFNVIFKGENISRLLDGLFVTVEIAFISLIISVVIGTAFGILMTSKKKRITWICRIYLEIIRIIPVLVWLFIFYFGISNVLNINLDSIVASIIVFSLWGIAEMGDLVRGALTSIAKHQEESALALGLKMHDIYINVLVPQAIRRVLPGTINLATRIIKTTSIVVLIGVVEVVKVGQQIIELESLNAPTVSFWIYGIIFIFYFIICYPLSVLSKKIELKWN
ncbi:MAG: amino acid ABC transporter permease [Clostridium sp.]